jgi:hypothetical protein
MTQTEVAASNGTNESATRKASVGTPDESKARSSGAPKAGSSNSTAELGAMILAFAFGGVGFALRIFWIPAMVAMAVVFGLLLADRRASRNKGVVAEIAGTVVHEAREIIQAASDASGDDSKTEASEKDKDADGSAVDEAELDHASKINAHVGAGTGARGPEDPKQPHGDVADALSRSDGYSPVGEDGASLAAGTTTPVQSIGKGKTEAAEANSRKAVIIGRVEKEPVESEAVTTEALAMESGEMSIEPDLNGSETDVESEQQPKSTDGRTESPPTFSPGRLFLSADRMVARNPLLRPVRKRLLGAVTSLSQTIVQLASSPPDNPAR